MGSTAVSQIRRIRRIIRGNEREMCRRQRSENPNYGLCNLLDKNDWYRSGGYENALVSFRGNSGLLLMHNWRVRNCCRAERSETMRGSEPSFPVALALNRSWEGGRSVRSWRRAPLSSALLRHRRKRVRENAPNKIRERANITKKWFVFNIKLLLNKTPSISCTYFMKTQRTHVH